MKSLVSILIKQRVKFFLIKLKIIFKKIMSPEIFHIITNKYRYKFKYKLRKFLYYGNNYYCPCCGSFLRSFAPFGKEKKVNVECPFCYVMHRHRLRYLFLRKKTNLFSENLSFLHFGPEFYLRTIFERLPNLDYKSADLNPENAELQMDITNIRFKDNYFDFIVCIQVIEHVFDDQKALKELFRVLKPGGCAIIEVPINYNLKKTVKLVSDEKSEYHNIDAHVRDYSSDFVELLEKTGFKVNVIEYKKELKNEIILKFGLIECDGRIYISNKPEFNNKDNSQFRYL